MVCDVTFQSLRLLVMRPVKLLTLSIHLTTLDELFTNLGGVAQWLVRRSMTGELFRA